MVGPITVGAFTVGAVTWVTNMPHRFRSFLQIGSRLLLIATVASGVWQQAVAGTRRHDVADSQFLSLANSDLAFDAVGKLTWSESGGSFLGSGTLIEDQWILTAAHNIDGSNGAGAGISNLRFQLGTSIHIADQWIAHPNWFAAGGENNLFSGWDIGLIRLSDTVIDIAPASLFSGANELGKTATLVGFGQTGTGLTGGQSGSEGTRRAGQNVIDVVGSSQTPGSNSAFAFGHDRTLAVDFDRPGVASESTLGSSNPLPLEYLTAPGDSGGALFVDVNGEMQVTGVTSFGSTIDGLIDSDYGDRGSYTRVSQFIDWIAETIAANSPVITDADFNQDGDIDGADFLTWQRGFGVGITLSEGDANGDNVVDAKDLIAWENQFGTASLPAFVNVPEPATVVLLSGVIGIGIFPRHSRSLNRRQFNC